MSTDPPARLRSSPPRDDPAPTGREDDAERVDVLELFREYRRTGDKALRNRLAEQHLRVVEPHVRRFRNRGIPADDLRQVALLAMVRSIDRFDPDLGVAFSTFASRTVEGELKRQLRDKGWAVRPPRRHQELFLAVRRAEDELVQSLGRSPTLAELAEALDESEDAVLEALEAGGARNATSLDKPASAGNTATPLDHLGAGDAGMGQVEVRVIITRLLEGLDEREREVITLRFFEELGQPEIAERLGLSQSYVSRLIRRILGSMRQELERDLGEQLPTGPVS